MKFRKPHSSTIFLLIGSLYIAFFTTALPTEANKNAGGLRLSAPIETPNSVQFSWTGGQINTTYGIYRKLHGDTYWERIKMGLTGISGSTFVQGFTLDQDYDYEIRAEVQ